MRVGYLTYGLDRAPTGIGRYAVNLLQAMATLDNAPEIVLLTTEQTDPFGLWEHFERQALPGCRLLPGLCTLGNIAISAATARAHLNIIHDPNGITPFLGPRNGASRVVTIHDAIPFVRPEPHNTFDNWRFRFMLPLAVRGADRVLTDSKNSLTDLTEHLPVPQAKSQIIYCGVESRFKPMPDDSFRRTILHRYGIVPPYILYIGGLNERKNLARLLEAYAIVREQHPAMTLVIGGKGMEQNSKLQATFNRLDLGETVRFTGYLEDADLPALYSAAELFVFPSLYEGFGLPPLEAMACGTPTITANTSSLPEVVGEAAITIDPLDIGALVSAINQVLTDDQLQSILKQRGLVRAAQFSWQQAASETVSVYQELVDLQHGS